MRRTSSIAILILLAGVASSGAEPSEELSSRRRAVVTPAYESTENDDAARTLIVSFDGISFDVVQRARQRGAFEGWPETLPLISTFPSMTNVAFTAIYVPLGTEPIGGYEMAHFDYELNKVHGGGPVGYSKRAFAWRDQYQVMCRTNLSKMGFYFHPRKKARKTVDKIEELVLNSPLDLMVAHLGSTDVMAHIRGADFVEDSLVELSGRIESLQCRHLEKYGRPLRVVMFSDHGNTEGKVQYRSGLKECLEDAGLNVTGHLKDPDDIVAPTYGVVSYGALYTRNENAERAARAIADHEVVDLAAWISAAGEVRIVSRHGEALVRWRETGDGGRSFAYERLAGDPLFLADALARMEFSGAVEPDGFAHEDAWLEATAFSRYPDGPRRLADSLTGAFVKNPATVIFSISEGFSWGTPAARVGAHLFGGKLEGTHGGLDRHSTNGFFLTNDPARDTGAAVRADRVLAEWAGLSAPKRRETEQLLGYYLKESPCCGAGGLASRAEGDPDHVHVRSVSRSGE